MYARSSKGRISTNKEVNHARRNNMSDKNKEIVEKVNASFAEGSPEGFLGFCADDVKWTMIGEKTTNGKEAIREWMKSMDGMEPPKFTVENLVADGDLVVANGGMTMKDEDGNTVGYAYCDIYRFRDGKIQELSSFVVKTDEAGKNLGASA